jgi:hypothetical protein
MNQKNFLKFSDKFPKLRRSLDMYSQSDRELAPKLSITSSAIYNFLKGQSHEIFYILFLSSINSIFVPGYQVKLFPYGFTFALILTL